MGIPLEDVMAKLTPTRRASIERRVQEMSEEDLTLRDLRSVQRLTQENVAELLGVEQDSVSRMERRADMLLSTMSSYVEAMGGKLRLIAEFPNRKPYTVKLGDLSEAGPVPRRRKAALKSKQVAKSKPAVKSKPRVKAKKVAPKKAA